MKTLDDKMKHFLKQRSGAATTTALLGLLSVEATASAQGEMAGHALSLMENVQSFQLLTDGSLSVIVQTGEVLTLPAHTFSVVGGEVLLTTEGLAIVQAGVSGAATASAGTLAAVGGVGAAGAATTVAESSSEESAPAPVDSTPPVISSGGAASVSENVSTETVVYQTQASDETATTLSYSLSGADAGLFEIDESGAVSFVASPDYEAPGSSAGSNEYQFTVNVSDGANTTSQDVVLSVTDVDETAPAITSSDAVSVSENVSPETVIYQTEATDETATTLTYSLSGADAGLFTIDGSGAVSFVASPDFETPGSAAGSNQYSVTVNVSDGTNTTSQAVTITVTDGNEDEGSEEGEGGDAPDTGAPVFSSGDTASVAETITDAEAVYTAQASDPDGTAVTYGLNGADAGSFAIDPDSGVVTFIATPDFETPGDSDGDNVYDILITATDGNGETATQPVTITVSDAAETGPVFEGDTFITVSENTFPTGYTPVAVPEIEGSEVTYAITGGADGALFALDDTTGELRFQAPPDFESPTDVGADHVCPGVGC